LLFSLRRVLYDAALYIDPLTIDLMRVVFGHRLVNGFRVFKGHVSESAMTLCHTINHHNAVDDSPILAEVASQFGLITARWQPSSKDLLRVVSRVFAFLNCSPCDASRRSRHYGKT
jgi:hypothetical protein